MKKHIALLALAAFTHAGAQAATFVVDATADLIDPTPGDNICGTGAAGTCSLRAAIMEANALAGADTITLPAGTFTLTRVPAPSNLLQITSDLTINGAGAGDSFIVASSGSGGDRIVLQILGSPTVNLNNLAITGGTGAGASYGGGLFIGGGTATLDHVAVHGNSAAGSSTQQGGGIYVYETATLHLIDSEVSGNTAPSGGGGIAVRQTGIANITRSTITGNTMPHPGGSGGGIANNGTLNLTNSTVSGNTAVGAGGGISGGSGGTTTIRFSTIAHNTTGAGNGQLSVFGATAHISGSIVANPAAGLNCRFQAGALVSGGNNLDSGTTCGFGAVGDIASANPLLAPLAYANSLPNQTHALLPGSPAINAGPTTDLPATDERGTPRVQMGRADIGAYESALAPGAGPGNGGGVQAVPVDSPIALALSALGLLGLALRGGHRLLLKK
ncbi:right-handed parallel beta-helix repeat-containing protein [Acidovorax sp. sif1233]|uniref:right-handed parallel beta-helix repeat-containing protein n=1 Tax=Acidovorax sp. sif1233 TaxID=2854792 RepID=UPI001C470472|nr:right-handed parallel beta-helix repeat-containing protein [Acidovorax sp. sif1233]MBV7456993.1 right-handed parallel beta-helix repeat-containing protein [Acidovorax sp. sif1233]